MRESSVEEWRFDSRAWDRLKPGLRTTSISGRDGVDVLFGGRGGFEGFAFARGDGAKFGDDLREVFEQEVDVLVGVVDAKAEADAPARARVRQIGRAHV